MTATVQRFLIPAIPLLLGACDALLPRRGAPPAEPPAVTSEPAPTPRPKAAGVKRAPAEPVDEAAVFGSIRTGLRRLVIAEQTYFAENGTYTSDLEQVRFRPERDVTVEMLWATRDGWAARGQHPALPDRDCVVYVGRSRPAPATKKYRRQADEGVPVCDARAATTRPVPPAPAAAPRAPAPQTASALDAVSPIVQMKVDLRNLARSQELWYGTQGAYSRRVEPFAMQYLWTRGVTVKILSAGREGWSAKATHARLPGKSCVIWYGRAPTPPVTDGEQRPAERAGVPTCDEAS